MLGAIALAVLTVFVKVKLCKGQLELKARKISSRTHK